MWKSICFLVSVTAVSLQPLDFNGFTADTVYDGNQAITCTVSVPYVCFLKRDHVAGVQIERSLVTFSKESHRIESASFRAHRIYEDDLLHALTDKYGKPTKDTVKQKVNKEGGPYEERTVVWDFDKRDYVYLYRTEEDVSVSFVWRQNLPPVDTPPVDF